MSSNTLSSTAGPSTVSAPTGRRLSTSDVVQWPPPLIHASHKERLHAKIPELVELGQDPVLGLRDLASADVTGVSYSLLRSETAELQVRTRF
jgi:hypothetical protein